MHSRLKYPVEEAVTVTLYGLRIRLERLRNKMTTWQDVRGCSQDSNLVILYWQPTQMQFIINVFINILTVFISRVCYSLSN